MHFDLLSFKKKFGLGLKNYTQKINSRKLEPQQMSQRGMNLAYMAADSHFSFSFRSFSYWKEKRRKTSQNDSAMEHFLIE